MANKVLHVLCMSDLHSAASSADASPIAARRSELAPLLLRKALLRLRFDGVVPDVLVLLGDLAEMPSRENLEPIAREARQSGVPILALPGNHDYSPELYRELFECEPGLCEIGEYGFLVFWDAYNERDEAMRTDEGLALPSEAARAHPDLALIALQHNPVYPDIESDYPYMPLNAGAIRSSYEEAGVVLSMSGHYHPGQEASEKGGVRYHTLGAMCESPFRFSHVVLDGRNAEIRTSELGLDMPGIWDCHCHTQMAYCATTSEVPASLEIARELGVGGVCLTEHSFQLYFDNTDAWSYAWKTDFEMVRRAWRAGSGRMLEYRALVESMRAQYVGSGFPLRFGLEVDVLSDGSLLVAEEDRVGWDIFVGAVHEIHDYHSGCSQAEAERIFMRDVERLLSHPISVLAHPFRWFRRKRLDVPRHLYKEVASMLVERGVAAEINYHTNTPDAALYKECLACGVPISFASDTHEMAEAGEFYPHLRLLRGLGCDDAAIRKALYSPA